MGACLSEKEGHAPVLYAKVKSIPTTKTFRTKFLKMRVKKGEEAVLDPAYIIGDKCEAIGLVRFESIYLSSQHASLQVKLDEVMLDFDSCASTFVLEPKMLDSQEEKGEDGW